MDNKHIHLKWQFPPNLTPLYSLQNVFRQHCGNRFSTWTYHGEYVVVFFAFLSRVTCLVMRRKHSVLLSLMCVNITSVEIWEMKELLSFVSWVQWKSLSRNCSCHSPWAFFPLLFFFFFFFPLYAPPPSFLLSWSGRTSNPLIL